MSKKKKRNSGSTSKNKSGKKLNKSNKKTNTGEKTLPKVEVVSKDLIETVEKLKDTTSTFSKKLEEIIEESGERKKIFGGNFFKFKKIKPEHQDLLQKLFHGVKGFSLMFLTLCFLATLFISLELFGHQRVFPRVVFANEGYSLENGNEAKAQISQSISSYLGQNQSFVWQDQTVSLSPLQSGLKIDLNKTIQNLPVFDFHQNYFWDLVMASFSQHKINPVYSIDQTNLKYLLTKDFNLESFAAQNANFYFDDKKNIQIKPEHDGQQINMQKLLSDLKNNVDNLTNTPIQIELKDQSPQVTTADLQNHQDDLLVKLETPITLKYQDSTWKIKLDDHLDLIDFTKTEDQIKIDLSGKFYQEYLEPEVLSKIEKAPSNIKISHDDKGKIVFEGDAVDGITVPKDKILNQIEMALEGLIPEVDIPTEITKAKIETDDQLQALGIKELIGVGHTNFAGSPPNRRFNISVGMNKLNGIIVKPGETFSFNDHLGPVDDTTGYKLELVIKAEGTIPEYGGGICQVSSTFYKAALRTGLPIVERANHSYAVSYYAKVDGYGLDATIYPGVHDLKFTNDTPASILLQTEIKGDDAYVKIYGTSDGRTVSLQDYYRTNYRPAGGTETIPTNTLPKGQTKQIESAHGGFDASWNRIINYADGTQKKENIYSVYRATSNKILVGQ